MYRRGARYVVDAGHSAGAGLAAGVHQGGPCIAVRGHVGVEDSLAGHLAVPAVGAGTTLVGQLWAFNT